MRNLVLVIALAACGKSTPPDIAAGSAPAPVTTVAKPGNPNAVALDHVTLLQPEAVLDTRIEDQDSIAATLKAIPTVVAKYDEAHPGALPASFDVVLVIRATGMRGWLVGDAGDIAVPALEQQIAATPAAGVKEGNLGAVLTMVRAGAPTSETGPRLPASWKAAGGAGAEVDAIIDRVWPK